MVKGRAFSDAARDELLLLLGRHHTLIGPVRGEDDIVRLLTVSSWSEVAASLPLLSLKKLLLPPAEQLWTCSAGEFTPPDEKAEPVAVAGALPCDLYGLGYLDQVFAEDLRYQLRRRQLFVVGVGCPADCVCRCPPRREPPPFDLFLAGEEVWAGTSRGEELIMTMFPGERLEEVPLPVEFLQPQEPIPADRFEGLEPRFRDSHHSSLWARVGERCLSCGACSAVCPTCYCYGVVDVAAPNGTVTRQRVWDNCFFRNHALVAGGHNFRPTRTERLRFRFEHKLLGFGPLRGTPACVGCGRCGKACPVDIDISEVLEQLTAEGRGA